MEIFIGLVVIVALMIVIGKMKGAPEPSSMSEESIAQRINSEEAWISRYRSQPYSSQQSASLKKMYEEKNNYIQQLKSEPIKRQLSQGNQAIENELAPILQRAAELIKEGKPEMEAHAAAIKEWKEKRK
jgi:hypothetical protein